MSYATLSIYNTSLSEDTQLTQKSNGFQRSNPAMNQASFDPAELMYPESEPMSTIEPKKENYSENELTDSTIKTLTKPTVVLFYAPWCGHCTHFMPIFNEAALQCKQSALDVDFSTLNGAIYTQTVTNFEVKGFPTVILIHNEKKTIYNGKRVSSDILAWVKTELK